MDIRTHGAPLRRNKAAWLIAAALLASGALGGWVASTALVKDARAQETQIGLIAALDARSRLVGTYAVSGTDSDGSHLEASTLDIALAPSGALELVWDNGRIVGVGQLVGDTLAVAYTVRNRLVISVMNVNADGSLSGKWLRRTDRGSKGTESWKKT
jgi:hypothetical protein